MLEIKNITKCYGTLKAVDNLSFTVNEGEIFGLLGVNGAGKTTTFRLINRLITQDEGTILLDGKPINYDVTDNIGFVPEERSLLPKLTVLKQAIYYGVLKGMDEASIEERLDYWLERFGIPEYKNKKIKELSKGNQQKIQLIVAILHNPKLLILDEPFSGLDPINAELFTDVIRELSNQGTAIIFSSHRMEHVELFCQKLVILLKGRSVLEGDLKEIKERYRKKNIIIEGDVDIDELKKIPGVLEVNLTENIEVKIESNDVINKVFKYIAKCSNITKFTVEEPSLNEIFVAKVGESYEE